MSTHLPPVFILNLARHPQRRVFMQEQLQSLPFEYEFIEAVDGVELTEQQIEELCQQQPMKYIGRTLARGELGCYLSHIKAMEIICRREVPEAVVLEDDVRISPDLVPFFEHRDRVPEQCGILQLGKAQRIDGDNGIYFWNRHKLSIYRDYQIAQPFPVAYGTQGYWVRQAFCAKVVSQAYPIIAPIDHKLFDIFCSVDFFYSLRGRQLVFHHHKLSEQEPSMSGRWIGSNVLEIKAKIEVENRKHVFRHFFNRCLFVLKLEELFFWWLKYSSSTASYKTICLNLRQRSLQSTRVLFLLKIYLRGHK